MDDNLIQNADLEVAVTIFLKQWGFYRCMKRVGTLLCLTIFTGNLKHL